MPSLGVSKSQWPVVAWIRLRLPKLPPPVMLTPGPPPAPEPPLDILEPNPVPTDPRRRVYAYEEERENWVLRLVWDTDDPELLEAECRGRYPGQRLPAPEVGEFWSAVKRLIAPIGPLPVDGADPLP